MRYRLLGHTGLRISELFLGAMSFGEQDGGAPSEECHRIVDLYADAGGNVIDTANAYRDGRSESILGEILVGRRDRFVLATKYTISSDRSDPNAAGNHRKNLTRSLEASLRRLRTDHVDVYWVHMWDRHTPLEETMRALDDAVRSGTSGGGDGVHRRLPAVLLDRRRAHGGPGDFIAESSPWVFGEASGRLDDR
jgi:aryl-alcohol dehydrogenase-like predicted oxidoreductase